MSAGDGFGEIGHIEPDYDSAAEAWLALEMVSLGMDFRARAEEIALEFYARLTAEKAEASRG